MGTYTKIEAIKKMIKDNEHLSISELHKRTGLSRTVFYAWKSGKFKNIQEKSVRLIAKATKTDISFDGQHVYINNYNVNIKGSNDMQINKENIKPIDAQYIIDLQHDKIESQNLKIKLLEKKISKLDKLTKAPKKDNWLDIDFDVMTRQTYYKSFCNYKTYEIIKYQDFFKKLGYNNDEVDYQYENHKNEMLQSDWKYDDSTLVSTVLGSKKDEAWVMKYKNKNITLYEYLDVRMKLGKSSATYDTPVQYYHKDGHLVNAYMYCSWDLQRLSGETKIKFLND